MPLHSLALLKPCCFGDVMFTTPLLGVLRRAHPESRIDYLVSAYARPAIEANPLLDNRFEIPNFKFQISNLSPIIRALRAGSYDAVFVPDRSPLLCLAAFLSGVRHRVGLNSGGRGLLYTHRAPVSPRVIRHEADIYLDLARIIGVPTEFAAVEYTPPANDRKAGLAALEETRLADKPFVLIHPGGGRNPGMAFDAKRWPPPHFAQLALGIMREAGLAVALVGGLGDEKILDGVSGLINIPFANLGPRPWGQIGALAERCALYIGNDTGATHMAVGAGARVVMILGPSDPRRYGPYCSGNRVAYVWREWNVPQAGVRAGARGFSWDDGATVEEAMKATMELLRQ
ncbi:MAG: glycosyltransferase family 9 protein [Chloroflexi bacterium]|nr:glycosyltransferase family 9 protein [Chloroflexota bacterium]